MASSMNVVEDVANLAMTDFTEKQNSRTPGQQESTRTLTSDDRGRPLSAIWECTPGEFASRRDGLNELCLFLAGSVEVEGSDGSVQVLSPGDVLILQDGWSGTWRIRETVRKVAFIEYTD
jgi:uncharacterized cupin superfamily protein